MGFFKKIFPKPKSLIQAPITLIKASPKDKIKAAISPITSLAKGDIGGALQYGANNGQYLQDRNQAAAQQATLQRRASAAEAQRQFYSQSPMTPSLANMPPIIPPSYGQLDDYIARINGNQYGTPGGYAPPAVPQQMQPGMQNGIGMQAGIQGGASMQPGMQPNPYMPSRPYPFTPLPRVF